VRRNFSSGMLFWECARFTRSWKAWGGAFFWSSQTTEAVSVSTVSSDPQHGQVTSRASGMTRLSAHPGAAASGGRASGPAAAEQLVDLGLDEEVEAPAGDARDAEHRLDAIADAVTKRLLPALVDVVERHQREAGALETLPPPV